MRKPTSLLIYSWPVGGLLLIAGCASPQDQPTEPVPALPVASVTATPIPAVRSHTGPRVKPPRGFGNAQGRVLWNGKGVPGVEVVLCTNTGYAPGVSIAPIESSSGLAAGVWDSNDCWRKTYRTTTDKDGNYTFERLTPDRYNLLVRQFNTKSYFYPAHGPMPREGFASEASYEIEANQTRDIPATELFKLDLQSIAPQDHATVATGLPRLSWKTYPGATRYEVSLWDRVNLHSQQLTTSSTSVTPKSPLLNGPYYWTVWALNADGVLIAKSKLPGRFIVTGQKASFSVSLLTPKDNAILPGSGNKVAFSWQKHPLAESYQLKLTAGYEKTILDFVDVYDTTYVYNQPLPPDRYFWRVSAMRNGTRVAMSYSNTIEVK